MSHQDPTPASAIDQTRDWLDWTDAALHDPVARNLDMVEAGALPIPPRSARVQAARYALERSVWHVYPGSKPRCRRGWTPRAAGR